MEGLDAVVSLPALPMPRPRARATNIIKVVSVVNTTEEVTEHVPNGFEIVVQKLSILIVDDSSANRSGHIYEQWSLRLKKKMT